MNASYMFPAILRTAQGKDLATGLGYVVNNEGRVGFESDFVPLIKMGERVQIVRVKQGIETHLLQGEVFISSPTILHITSAEEFILEGAARCISVDCSISAELTAIEKDGTLAGPVDAVIYSLSPDRLHFASPASLENGDEFLLTLDQPFAVSHVRLQIYRCLLFGQESASYQCKIIGISTASLQNLKRFIMENLWQHHSLLRSPIDENYPRYR